MQGWDAPFGVTLLYEGLVLAEGFFLHYFENLISFYSGAVTA